MEKLKISVVVPVYKAETYLRRCLDSLLSQSLEDFEILLVDDGSPDKSGIICDEYARKDNRIRVFHKPNGGVSSARQKGLDEAKGEYVIHADPDDWVEPDMLDELYKKAKAEEADMVICDYYINFSQKQLYVTQKPSSLEPENVQCELFQQLHGSCCNKLIRRACYKKYQIKFPQEIFTHEDLYVNLALLNHHIKVAYLHRAFYHYDQVINTNSLVRKTNLQSRYDNAVKILDIFQRLLNGTKAYDYARRDGVRRIVNFAFNMQEDTSASFKRKYYQYRNDILVCKNREKYFWYFSCLGYYKICFSLWKIISYFYDLLRFCVKT